MKMRSSTRPKRSTAWTCAACRSLRSDSAETKDIDDAISLMKLQDGGFELGVHIADVSHYVRPGMAMDSEAFERAHQHLLCRQGHPDAAHAALERYLQPERRGRPPGVFLPDAAGTKCGNIHGYQFVKTVIRSRVKGVYKEINALLEGSAGEDLREKYAAVLEQLPAMQELYEKRLELRRARGGMEIESDEAKLVINEEGRCVDIVKRTRGVSECMIEEFMLLANQCAANAGRTHQYRLFTACTKRRTRSAWKSCAKRSKPAASTCISRARRPPSWSWAAILDETREMPIHIPVHTGILRSMQKARYSPEPLGHFGLVLKDYAHFTSPIRRYPDLAIHRILTDMLVGAPHERLVKNYNEFAAHTCEQSSRQEVAAVRIERDVEDCYKAEYMHGHLGEVYTGTISGVTPRGVFVALENTVEGFVPACAAVQGRAHRHRGRAPVRPADAAATGCWATQSRSRSLPPMCRSAASTSISSRCNKRGPPQTPPGPRRSFILVGQAGI